MQRAGFPLSWPDGWKRTPSDERKRARFAAGQFVRSRDGILHELRLMRAVHPTITSNLPLKSNGLPYATGRSEDPGVAVWWIDAKIGTRGTERVIACDVYRDIADNLHAIQLTLAAMRGIGRWGANQVVERAFAGFAALPPGSGEASDATPIVVEKPWHEVLGMDPEIIGRLDAEDSFAIAKARHKKLALERHPDQGGSHEAFAELTRAFEQAQKEIFGE